jgi:hypothetical protein
LLASYLGSPVILNTILVALLGATMALFFGTEILFLNLLISLVTILIKSIVIGAFGIAICTVVRPMFGLVMTISYWILTYSVSDIKFFLDKVDANLSKTAIDILNWTVPQFYLFNWKSYVYLTTEFAFREVIWSWFHCFGWIFLLLFTASLLIRRKDIV